MTTSPTVKCRPYFKLLNQVHRFLPRVGQAPWSVPALCAAYSWPTSMPGGGTIAIVELGGGWVQSDLDSFFQSVGQPVPSVTDVSVDSTKNTPGQGDADYEVALDIQVAAAAYFVATGHAATIRVYWSTDIATAVAQAAADGCSVCSISWGADEAQWGKTAAAQMETTAEQATSEGMVIFAASGDNDSSDGGSTPANVDIPASCPHVVGCGGTFKTPSEETVWNDNPGKTDGEGTGDGYSTLFPAQPYQLNAPAAPANTSGGKGRMVPDVAADADPNTGYSIFVHGQSTVIGGTSAVAPLYSGLFAAFGKNLGFVNPLLWKNPKAFRDITSGNNGFFSAAAGPDPCSGLGAPNGALIAELFVPKR